MREMNWCQPGDKQEHQVWMVCFDDPDKRTAIFEGPEAEHEAREFYKKAFPSWNCWLFAAVPWFNVFETDNPS